MGPARGYCILHHGCSLLKNGQYSNAVETIVTFQVDSVSRNSVTGTVEDYSPYTGLTNTDQVTCPEGNAPCLGRFWLDPKNPTDSIKGEMGVAYSVAGRQQIQLLGKTWDATLLQYKDAQRGLDFHLYYDTVTGLILSYSIRYPNQEVLLNLNSINIGNEDYDLGITDGYNGHTRADTENGYQNNNDNLDISVDPLDRY